MVWRHESTVNSTKMDDTLLRGFRAGVVGRGYRVPPPPPPTTSSSTTTSTSPSANTTTVVAVLMVGAASDTVILRMARVLVVVSN